MELGFGTEEAVSTEISLHNPQNCTLLCFYYTMNTPSSSGTVVS